MESPTKEAAMRRSVLTLVATLVLGLTLGASLSGLVGALHGAGGLPVKVTELYKTDLVESDGREGSLWLAELAPGAAVGRHYHPGDAFAYILDGTLTLEMDGQTPVTLKPGESGSVRPGQIHDDRNSSQTQPLKFLVFHIARKGQPLAIPAK
jgi:quercetin dioxygenase-like cupin family protein